MGQADQSRAGLFTQRCIAPNCRRTFGINERLYVCSHCGGLLEIENRTALVPETLRSLWAERRSSFSPSDRSGVWRFRELLPFEDTSRVVTLIEGNTPLYDAPRCASYCSINSIQLKHQGANPTGSFKDTGMTTALTQARTLSARLVVCASTGNTAASLAAYAARANIVCAILVPSGYVSAAKLAQALDYGAKVLELEGNFDTCMRVMRDISDDQSIYLVNSINPFRIEGQKTVAVELAEQLNWQVPDHLVVPGGNLGNSSAFGKGFRELFEIGLIDRMPKITVVQAYGAAPFAHLYVEHGHDDQTGELTIVDEAKPNTLASAIRIGAPISWRKAWRAVRDSGGQVLTVTEQEIADAKAMIGRDGIGCEPASATTVAGIRRLAAEGFIGKDEKVIGVLTGHLLKDSDYVIKYHSDSLQLPWLPEDAGERRISGQFRNTPMSVSPASIGDVLKKMQEVE